VAAGLTVAIPVKDGATVLDGTLAAVRAQRPPGGVELELVVCDSGSRDRSVAIARGHGAEVFEIPAESFSHGGTRNLLMERSSGAHVAFLTQDAAPAADDWLALLLGAFSAADDVALAFGPYLPRPGASAMVARELTEWFASFSPSGELRIDRLASSERSVAASELLGPRGFFTDANGCVARAAWESVPFRPVAYAEDHTLAHDMLRAGYAKAYVPGAAVVHSHDYSSWNWLRRSFDEARALHEVYGLLEPAAPARVALELWGRTGADWRWQRSRAGGTASVSVLARSAAHHAARRAGAILGTRADRLPTRLVRRLSIEGRHR
jgi:rhamnosyltransferase